MSHELRRAAGECGGLATGLLAIALSLAPAARHGSVGQAPGSAALVAPAASRSQSIRAACEHAPVQ